MTKVEENKNVIGNMLEVSEQKPSGTFEEMTVLQLGIIATMLSDISKSLAVLADNADGAKIVLTSAEPQESRTVTWIDEIYKDVTKKNLEEIKKLADSEE